MIGCDFQWEVPTLGSMSDMLGVRQASNRLQTSMNAWL